jgi:dTDP-4-amino-4,6-dideoxygalactose transaminase
MINFGITGPENIDGLGINAKMSEFQAAMGLCVLDEIESNVNLRRRIVHQYQSKLAGLVQFQELNPCIEYNGAYVPAVFDTEEITLRVQSDLNECGVNTRRYFYPSLDSLRFFSNQSTVPISNDISRRILCLPIYSDLTSLDLDRICDSIHASLSH